jgi:hypothetical protein
MCNRIKFITGVLLAFIVLVILSISQAHASPHNQPDFNVNVKQYQDTYVKTHVEQHQEQQSTNTNTNGINFNDNSEVNFPANSAGISHMSPSAQCMGVATGGIQGMSIGIALGKSYESKPCNQRELARLFYSIGLAKASAEVTCSIEGADVTTFCKELKETK